MKEVKNIWLKAGREKSVQRFHPWLFSGGIAKKENGIEEGDVVRVLDANNQPLATGFYSPSSISIRIFSFGAEEINQALFLKKIQQAWQLRVKTGFTHNQQTNAYRLIHGEGDGMPGTIVDIYNDVAVLQCHHLGIYHFRNELAEVITGVTGIKNVYSKSARILKKDAGEDMFLTGNHSGQTEIRENGLMFNVDVVKGQKTGFFLDQRDNRKLLRDFAKGKDVLNTFSYSGGFSVYALDGGAASVCSVDSSAHAIELAEKNVALNNGNHHSTVCTDAVDYIGDTSGKYDVIVLDPPAFAKHMSAQKEALRGYRRINFQAIKNIRNSGFLFTFSCSQAVSQEMFESAVMASAIEAKRDVKILHRLTQPADHPVSVFHPEGEYLKGLVLYIE